MTSFKKSSAFITQKRKTHIKLQIVKNDELKTWLKKQDASVRKAAAENGFDKEEAILLPLHKANGNIKSIVVRMGKKPGFYDMARVVSRLQTHFSSAFLKNASFEITGLSKQYLTDACVSWGLAAYSFDTYKKKKQSTNAALLLPDSVNKTQVKSAVESIFLLRDMVNTPANDMGPEEIEAAVKALAKSHDAKVKVVKDQKILEKDFPLVFTVGKASPRKPRLIDMSWGNPKHPKVTLVGKGVAFDTGGLDLKPSAYMKLMKKDMGGAAHTIALANLIMDHKLKVRLRLIIPAVENSVAGEAFRPGDIMKSRKGVFVENTNTDAEGRLILADALTYASEGKPDLIIDYATLTGSARAGLGPDIPAMFANNDKVGAAIQKSGEKSEDPVWQMPLWQPYRKHIENSTGDLLNSAGIPGDGIYSALFLETFVDKKIDWVHLDCFSWEQTGRPGRPKGAADTGLRAVFAYLQDRYG